MRTDAPAGLPREHVALLVDPVSGAPLALEEGPEPALVSPTGARFPVRDGIPRFVAREALPADQASTGDTFSRKWSRISRFGHDDATRDFHHRWYLERYGWGTEDAFARFLATCDRVLDAGCGVGRDVAWYLRHTRGTVAGVDISTAVDSAAENAGRDPRLLLVQGDLAHLPFAPGSFDYVACDQVLQHTADPHASFRHLVSRVRPGGVLAFYVYKVKGPVREFSDDHLRKATAAMSEEEAYRFSEAVTRFGQALTEQRLRMTVPVDIPELGITAGDFDVQRWIYWTMFKCFYNADWDWETNVMTNYDWYRPATAFRYRPEEIRAWIAAEPLEILHEDIGDAGLSYRCRRTPS
ncbi:MAG TPA: class I SAM-dependent methyltransferase [Gemmatimonadales bacterium]